MNLEKLLPIETAIEIFVDQEKIDVYIEKIREEATSHVPDLTNKKGRDHIASIAHKVAKCKTYLEKCGKALADQEREKIDETLSKIMKSRKKIVSDLDAIRDQVRQPLTDYEAKIDKIKLRIAGMVAIPVDVEKHLRRLEATNIDDSFGDLISEAAEARTWAINECKERIKSQEEKLVVLTNQIEKALKEDGLKPELAEEKACRQVEEFKNHEKNKISHQGKLDKVKERIEKSLVNAGLPQRLAVKLCEDIMMDRIPYVRAVY